MCPHQRLAAHQERYPWLTNLRRSQTLFSLAIHTYGCWRLALNYTLSTLRTRQSPLAELSSFDINPSRSSVGPLFTTAS